MNVRSVRKSLSRGPTLVNTCKSTKGMDWHSSVQLVKRLTSTKLVCASIAILPIPTKWEMSTWKLPLKQYRLIKAVFLHLQEQDQKTAAN